METINQKSQDKKVPEMKQKPYARMYKPEEIDRLSGREMPEKRTRTGKVYSLSGNLYQSILYPDPVHFQDRKTGLWEEIINTLVSKKDKSGTPFLSNKRNGDLTVSLYPASSSRMVVLENDNGSILSWTLEGAQGVVPQTVMPPSFTHRGRDQRRKVLKQIESEAVYHEILPGADLVCRVLGTKFKDELIFHTFESAVPVTYLLSAPSMTLSAGEDGAVSAFSSAGEREFTLPAPFLKDAAKDAGICMLKTGLEKAEDQDVWRITYTPDQAWLQRAVFPVVLDPVVETRHHSSVIQDNFITSVDPDTSQDFRNTNLRISYGSTQFGTSKSFIKFLTDDLPAIDSSYYVTKAYFSIAFKTAPATGAAVYLKEVLEDWTSDSITYNNQPATSEFDTDYEYAPTNVSIFDTMPQNNTRLNYDISNLVRKWYTDVNYGIMLESKTNTYFEFFSSDHAYAKPYVLINYVSLAGLEDYLAYETQSVGRAGTGYVSIYNGNLIFEHQDTDCNGNLMPVSVSHFYNSCYKGSDAFGAGNGWKTSIQQCLHKETISTSSGSVVYYVYTDGDGTRHHFKQNGSIWEDQSGLSMKLTISGSTAAIRDKADNVMTFDLPTVEFGNNYANVKMLRSIQDALGNTAAFTLSGTGITNAQDGAGRNTTITTTGGRMSSINAPGYSANGVSYTYNGAGQLTQITHEDGAVTTYTYNSLGLLESATNLDGLTVTYEYYTVRAPYRVKKVTVSNGEVLGNCRQYEYKDCLTVITDMTVPDGKKLFYHFNDYGNVVSVNDQLGYAAFAKYSVDSPVNHPEAVSKMQRAVCNLVTDCSIEANPLTWGRTPEGETYGVAFVTDTSYVGSRCAKIYLNELNCSAGLSKSVFFRPNVTYTLSAYVKRSGNMNLSCYILYSTPSGHFSMSRYFSTNELSTEFEKISYTFVMPSDVNVAINGLIDFEAWNCIGEIWIDCVQVEEGGAANRLSFVNNGDHSNFYNTRPSLRDWSKLNNSYVGDDHYVTDDKTKPEGLSPNIMRIYGDGINKSQSIYQNILLSGSAGDIFTAGGWSKGYSKPRKGENNLYGIRLAFKNSAGTYEDAPSIEWSDEWTEWQFACAPVIAPCDYTEIRFYIDYQKNINYAEFDGLFLHKEEFGQSFTYDENKNIVAVKNLASQMSNANYDAYNNLISYRQPGRPEGVQTTLEYGVSDADKKKHLLLKSIEPMGVMQTFQYDNKGNQTEVQSQDGTAGSFIKGMTGYAADQNYVVSQTDGRGKIVTSNVDLFKGTLDSVTAPNNQTVNYEYDVLKRITAAATVADGNTYKNEYVYNGDKITQVKHNTTSDTSSDMAYEFAYDALGNLTTTKVGTQLLSTNMYTDTGDKTLSRVEYGNGGKVEYIRDGFRRIKGIRYDGATTDRYQYQYGANGEVASVKDNNLGRTETYEYDLANRLMRVKQMNGGTHLYTSALGYDAFNNLNSFKEKVATVLYETTYTYDNGSRPVAVQFGDPSCKVGYTYDALGRINNRTTTVGGLDYTSSYGFVDGGHGVGSTTALMSSIAHPGQSFTYTYDDVGNITTETRNGFTTSYAYDNLGQLFRVNDQRADETWTFEYDRGGNILSKKRYAYTVGILGAVLQEIPYVYGDINWKDKLTRYNSTSISYDAIGNVTYDGSCNYYWQAGRQLRTINKNGIWTYYYYNSDGIRTRKYQNSVYTDYTLHGKQVAHLKQGTDNLHFFYDAQGRPSIVDFNGTRYGYVHNLQDDIVAIIDDGGNQVVEYTYDAWGKQLTKTGSLATTLGTLNPFRYRGYLYDEETGLYYLQTRYYNPIWGRFISADNIDIKSIDKSTLLQYNSFSYCLNNPINRFDESGTWSLPNWAKVVIGAVATVAAVAITVATGGAAAPLLVGVATSTLAGAAVGYVTGGVEGMIDGAADGFMWGGITSLASSTVSAVRAIKTAKQGVTIGENMSKVKNAASAVDATTYKAMRGYKSIKKVFGTGVADKLSLAHNKTFITRMTKLGAAIYDNGPLGTQIASKWYNMERQVVSGYYNYVRMY